MTVAVAAFFTLLPLQWFAVASTPLGQARLHQVVILGLAAVVLLHYPLRRYAPVLRTAALFVAANLYMVVAIAAVQAYNGLGLQLAGQQLLYLLCFVALAALFYRVAVGREPAVLGAMRYAALLTCSSLVLGLGVAMAANGVNPAAVLASAVETADPAVVQQEIYRAAFAGFGIDDDEVQGNLRHEIFGAVLVSMLISTWAMRTGTRPTRAQRIAHTTAMVLGTSLLVLSLSRSILIAALVWPLLVLLRSARRAELSRGQLAILLGSGVALAAMVVSGLATVVVNRFATDVTGYQSRAANYRDAFAAVPDVWVTGGYDTAGASSHNFVLDALLRSGIFAALPAAVIVVCVVLATVLLVARLDRLPAAAVPVTAALALPLVRLGTAGGGLIPPIGWVAFAFVAGVAGTWLARPREPAAPVRAPAGQRVVSGV